MKKNNDGYVLPFVLVVMIVLCIMSASLMTAAFRNLQMQQKFTDRMVDKYEAQGEIEKIVAQLKQDIVIKGNESEELTAEELTPENLAKSLGLTDDKVRILEVTQADTEIKEDEMREEDEQTDEKKSLDFIVSLTSTSSSEATTIACELLVSAEYSSTQDTESSTYKHTIDVDKCIKCGACILACPAKCIIKK